MPASFVQALEMFTPELGVAVAGPPAFVACSGRDLPRPRCPRAPGPDALVETSDGGLRWQVTGTVPRGLDALAPFELHMAFTNPSSGYLLSTGPSPRPEVELTEDSGQTWAPVSVPGLATALSLNANDLWVVSDICPSASTPTSLCPSVLSIYQFGARTPSATRPIPTLGDLAVPEISPSTRAATLLARLGPDAAVLREGGGGLPSSMLLTTDGGVHWHEIGDPCGDITPSSLALSGPTHWVLDCELDGGMNQGTVSIDVSSDEGLHWKEVAAANGDGSILGSVRDFMGYDLTASGNGTVLWLPDDVVGIQTSTDGGQRWTLVRINDGGGCPWP